MAFPSSPSDGDIHYSYTYDSTKGAWVENYCHDDSLGVLHWFDPADVPVGSVSGITNGSATALDLSASVPTAAKAGFFFMYSYGNLELLLAAGDSGDVKVNGDYPQATPYLFAAGGTTPTGGVHSIIKFKPNTAIIYFGTYSGWDVSTFNYACKGYFL